MNRTYSFLLAAIFAAALFSSCAKKTDQAGAMADSSSMTAGNNGEANKAAVKGFYEDVINAHNVNAMDKYTAANFVDHNPEMGHSGQGIDDAKKSFTEWFASMPDAHMTIDRMVADGDMV